MGLSFTILQWYFDGACLWSWALQTVDGVPLSSFGMPSAARRIRKACFGEIAVTGWGAATNRAPLRDGCCGSATCAHQPLFWIYPYPYVLCFRRLVLAAFLRSGVFGCETNALVCRL